MILKIKKNRDWEDDPELTMNQKKIETQKGKAKMTMKFSGY